MSLSEYFGAQAAWRAEKADEFPEDPRNAQSARALESLAEYAASEDAGPVVADLEWFLTYGLKLGGENTQREVIQYGFGYEVSDSTHREVLKDLAARCHEDAYYSAKRSEEWIEALLPCEIEAARAGVEPPRRYFELRGNMTEDEIEDAMAAYSGE